jgi:hypothetical protein
VAAADASGRVITYDVRFMQEVSLSNHIRFGFTSGTTPADIEDQHMDKTEAGIATQSVNYWIAGASFAVMATIYIVQRILIRRRKNQGNGDEL